MIKVRADRCLIGSFRRKHEPKSTRGGRTGCGAKRRQAARASVMRDLLTFALEARS